MNFIVIFLAALIPLAVGAFYYSPALFQNAWMKASGMTEEKMKGGNMLLIFGLTYLFSLFLAGALITFTIHQADVPSIFVGAEKYGITAAEAEAFLKEFMEKYGHLHRNFTHGLVHGIIATIFFIFPIIAINSLFERRSWKYILMHTGYWLISASLMGGVLCQFL